MVKSAVVMFSYYFVFVTVNFFYAPYLEAAYGLGTGELFSYGLFLAVGLMFVISYFVDSSLIKIKTVLIWALAIVIVQTFGLMTTNLTLITISYVGLLGVFLAIPSILDTLVVHEYPQERYGLIRSFGSLGAAISYFFSSYFLGNSEFSTIILINILFIVAALVIVMTIKDNYQATRKEYSLAFKHMWAKRNILLVLLLTFVTYGIIRADDAYNYQYTTEIVKITPFVVGVIGLTSIGVEFMIMATSQSFIKRINLKYLLLISSVILTAIVYTKYAFYTNQLIINIGNIALGIFVGVFIPVVITILNDNTQSAIKATILSLYQTLVLLGGAIFAYITAMYINAGNSLHEMYWLHAIIVSSGIIISLLMKKEKVN